MSATRKNTSARPRRTAKPAGRTGARRAAATPRKGAVRAPRPQTASGPPPSFSFHPLTPDRWRDLEALFGERGACGGCWCMWPRIPRADYEKGKGLVNKRAFQRIVAAGDPPGILAYANGAAVGWCAVAPRAGLVRLEGSRVLAPVDDQPVWSVVCFFIAKPFRRQGLSVVLLQAAASFAAERGARLVEGYPYEPRGNSADAFVWTGLVPTFEKAGFAEVLRRSPQRPIMRRAMRASGAANGKSTAKRARG